ncbi:MAG: site-2 protease family protein, partial [Candidatus Margulisbacteria bacterium]|nr:site-2 protease family protein [Candidatus Margulisiibacteriota bacterium]
SYFPMTVPEYGPMVRWSSAVIAALLLFASLLAHELSHSVVAIRNSLPIAGITLFIFGGVAHMEKEPPSPAVEFKMAIAGPLMSLFLALVFLLLTSVFYLLRLPRIMLVVTDYLSFINLLIACFNLVPAFPLDGGRVFRSAIWYFTKSLKKATRIASGFGKGFAFILMGFGFLALLSGRFIEGIWFIFIGLFLSEAADISYKQVLMKKVLTGTKVKEVMTREVITVSPDITLQELLKDYFFRYRHNTFPVMKGTELLGFITFHDIKEIPQEKWHEVSAREIMIHIKPSLVIKPDSDLIMALAKMAKNKFGRLLVLDGHHLLGIVSQKDIMHLFELKSEFDNGDEKH